MVPPQASPITSSPILLRDVKVFKTLTWAQERLLLHFYEALLKPTPWESTICILLPKVNNEMVSSPEVVEVDDVRFPVVGEQEGAGEEEGDYELGKGRVSTLGSPFEYSLKHKVASAEAPIEFKFEAAITGGGGGLIGL